MISLCYWVPALRGVFVVGLSLLLLCSCDRIESWRVGAPIAAGVDSPDQDVAEYLRKIYESARVAPNAGLTRGQLAMAYDVNGFHAEALITYRQAESLDADDFRWPYFASQLHAEVGNYVKALDALQRAMAIDPDYAPAWMWRGTWLLETGQLIDAMIAFQRAEDLGVGPMAILGRARVMARQGRDMEAVDLIAPLAQVTDHPFVHRTLGESLRALNRIDEARVAMVRGKDAEPVVWLDERGEQRTIHLRGYASYERAKSLSGSGRIDEAIQILERLQHYHPEAECGRDEEFFLACNLMNSFSIAFDRLGLPSRAIETVQRGLVLKETFMPLHLTMANLYRQERDLDRSLVHIDRAIELNPAHGFAHEQRGRLLFGLKRYEDAQAAFESALQFEPGQRTTLFYLGLADTELGHWPEAVERFERLVRIDPDFALGHVFLARSLAETGRLKDARQAQRDAVEYGADREAIRLIEIRLRELEAKQ